MSTDREVLISSMPGPGQDEQICLVMVTRCNQSTVLELRQQSWADGVGWFTQSTVQLQADQARALRAALGTTGLASGYRERSSRAPQTRDASQNWSPRILRADSA